MSQTRTNTSSSNRRSQGGGRGVGGRARGGNPNQNNYRSQTADSTFINRGNRGQTGGRPSRPYRAKSTNRGRESSNTDNSSSWGSVLGNFVLKNSEHLLNLTAKGFDSWNERNKEKDSTSKNALDNSQYRTPSPGYQESHYPENGQYRIPPPSYQENQYPQASNRYQHQPNAYHSSNHNPHVPPGYHAPGHYNRRENYPTFSDFANANHPPRARFNNRGSRYVSDRSHPQHQNHNRGYDKERFPSPNFNNHQTNSGVFNDGNESISPPHTNARHQPHSDFADQAQARMSEEEVRQMQQERFRRDALKFQQRQQEENERQRLKEEKKRQEWLDSQRMDAGYRLGGGEGRRHSREEMGYIEEYDNEYNEDLYGVNLDEELESEGAFNPFHQRQENEYQRQGADLGHQRSASQSQREIGFEQWQGGGSRGNRSAVGRSPSPVRDSALLRSVSPDLKLPGETEEQFLQRLKEEQQVIEALIQSQLKKNEEDEILRRVMEQSKNETRITQDVTQPARPGSRNVTSSESNTSASSQPTMRPSAPPQLSGSKITFDRNPTAPPTFNEMRQNFIPNTSNKTSETRGLGAARKPIQAENRGSMMRSNSQPDAVASAGAQVPAARVLRTDSQGATLVLRPTEEDLNKALANKLTVIDEIDKMGHSAAYKPNAHPDPEFSNNRFDKNNQSAADIGKATGAIPKQRTPTSPPAPEVPKSQSEIDHQAEMRAARLRMQQKYEESLKAKQENQDST